jgi:DNA-3-methyladenine glycosylase II
MNKDLSLDGLPRKTVVEVRDQLIKIKGIRYCTIGVYLMFSSQDPAILIGDVAVQTTIKELFGIHNKEEMILSAEKWSPYPS